MRPDIYDRLQLIQILDWFRRYASNGALAIYVLNIERPLNLLTRDEIMDYIIFYRERVTPHEFS